MKNSWEGLLDLFEIPSNLRKRTVLEVWQRFPTGHPKYRDLYYLYNSIKELFYSKDKFILAWFEEVNNSPGFSYLKTKIICRENISFIRNMWDELAGLYILFLPGNFKGDTLGIGDEDTIIGEVLCKNRKLLLKTPDGQELLLIYIDDNKTI